MMILPHSFTLRALLTNKKYSWIAADEMIVHLNFTSFQKTSGNKIGVNFEVLLNRPNWNNDYRIEQSFKIAADEYASRNETSVLGKDNGNDMCTVYLYVCLSFQVSRCSERSKRTIT